MDTSQFKRREVQQKRQTNKNPLGISGVVPRTLPPRPVAGQAPVQQTRPNPVIASRPPVMRPVALKPPIAPAGLPHVDPELTERFRAASIAKRPTVLAAPQRTDIPKKIEVLTPIPVKKDEEPRRMFRPIAAEPAPVVVPVQVAPTVDAPIQPAAEQVAPEPIETLVAAPVEQAVAVEAAPTSRAQVPIDMALPGETSKFRAAANLLIDKRWAKIRKYSIRGAIGVTVLVIGVGMIIGTQGYFKLHKVFRGGAASVAALTKNVNPDLLKGEGDGRINVLLLGRGGGTHEAPDLTDTIMVDSIDPVNHTSVMLSVPRDLWVDVPNQGAMKINAAYETGEFKYLGKVAPGSTNPQAIAAGFNEIDQEVESVLGIQIHYNMMMNFSAFQKAVDTVGGVTVNVPTDLIDPTMAWQNNHSSLIAKAGIDTFNGKQALNYVRSRETTSDFARSQRQRAVIEAIKTKVDTLGTLSNPLKISGLLNSFGDNVNTDMSITDAARLYNIVKGISDANTTSIGLADGTNHYITTGVMGNQSIDEPTAGLFSYGDIQTYVRSQLKDGYLVKENASVEVLNGTPLQGIATAESNTLKSYGYNVVGAGVTPNTGYTQTTVIDLSHGKDPYTKHYLEQRFNVTAKTSLPDPKINTNGAAFVIIVGSDEASSTQN